MKLLKFSIALTTLSLACITSSFALSEASNTASSNNASLNMPSTFDHWLIRARGLAVLPSAHSTTISAPIYGNVTTISNQIIPELDFTYFFSEHIGTELILGTSHHSVTATGTAVGTVGLGKVWLLPPTLTLQYHFFPHAKFSPYVGAGINDTIFYDPNPGSTASKITYGNSFGPALQIGADIPIKNKWSFNIDVKKIFINSNVAVTIPAVGTVNTRAYINPWIIGLGIGYRL